MNPRIGRTIWVSLTAGLILLSLACGSQNAEISRAYEMYRWALQNGDFEAVKEYLTVRRVYELSNVDSESALQMIRAFSPKDVTVAKTSSTADSAVLELVGDFGGQRVSGKARLIKEDGRWKIDREDWRMSTSVEEVTSALPGPRSFLPDPKQPPRPFKVLAGHQDGVTAVGFTPNGRFLISSSYGDLSLRVWNPESGLEVQYVQPEDRVRIMQVAGTGDRIFTADVNNNITIYPLANGQIGTPRPFKNHAGDTLALSPDSRYLAAAIFQKPATAWELGGSGKWKDLEIGFNPRVMAFGPQSKVLAAGGRGSTLVIWDTATWKSKVYAIKKVSRDSDMFSLDISADGRYLASGHSDSTIMIFDLAQGRELHNWFVRNAATLAVKFSRDSALLCTAHQDRTVYVWDAKSRALLHKLQAHGGPVSCLAFSPDGSVLATAGDDRKIILWRAGAAATKIEQPVQERQDRTAETVPPKTEEVVPKAEEPAVSTARKPEPVRPKPQVAAQKPKAAAKKMETAVKPPAPVEPKARTVQETQARLQTKPEAKPAIEPEMEEFQGRKNLVKNPKANQGVNFWTARGEASVEKDASGDAFFIVRNGGSFEQDIALLDAQDAYVLVMARSSSERIEKDGDQTGLPYLSGELRNSSTQATTPLTARTLTHPGGALNEWAVVWGMMAVPPGADRLRLSLRQADGRRPQNGSAARFDNVSVYVLMSETMARMFVTLFEKKMGTR